jgi:hypothetical protein
VDLLRIEGPRDDVARLLSVPGLQVVVSSARPVDGGRSAVSAFGDAASVPAGPETRTIKSDQELYAKWAAPAAAAAAERVGGGYLTSTHFEDRLTALATDHPDLCRDEPLPNKTHETRRRPSCGSYPARRPRGRSCSSSAASTRASGLLPTRCCRSRGAC